MASTDTRFEGRNDENQFVVTQWPSGEADVSDYYVHRIPEIQPGQKKHRLSAECHCMPLIGMKEPKRGNVVWTYTHQEVARNEPGQDAGQGSVDGDVATADGEGRPDVGEPSSESAGEAELEADGTAEGLSPQATDVEGLKLYNVHAPTMCAGEICVIHNPSEHHMREWQLHWRDDRGIFERICEHGVGHPDPSQTPYWKKLGLTGMGVHGCDGCCVP